jgi:hypothetical protein
MKSLNPLQTETDVPMRINFKLHLLFLALLNLSGFAHAQGTAIGYQGRLNQGGAPATGLYDFTFDVFAADAGGAALAGRVILDAVPVTNGLFTAGLDFGADIFTGAPRWLEISVRASGVGVHQVLSPRTALSPTPYTIFAGSAANVANGTVTAGQLNTAGVAPAPGQILSYDGGNLAWTDPGVAAGGIWSVLNNNTFYTAGNVGIGGLAGTSKLQITGADAMTLVGAGPYLSWRDTGTGRTAAISSAGGTLYYRVPNAANAIVTAGYVDSNGMVTRGRHVVEGDQPFVTWQDNSSGRSATISTANGTLYYRVPNAANTTVTAGYVDSNGTVTRGRMVVEGSNPYITWQDNASGRSATISTANGTLYYRVPNAENTTVTAGYVDSNGMVVNGRVAVAGTVNASEGVILGNNPGTIDAPIYSDNAASTRVVLYNTANAGLMDLHCRNGDVSTLTIRGGADLAEPFAMSQPDVEPGSVVVIDPTQAGKLRLSTQAYDNKVAGIVSGANGINPGISMIQEDKLEGGKNVALSGRVFVRADASTGSIEPGDLLTTAATAGHAMKVSDHTRSQGAILGKAMSALKEGKGMVLVLVTLQ